MRIIQGFPNGLKEKQNCRKRQDWKFTPRNSKINNKIEELIEAIFQKHSLIPLLPKDPKTGSSDTHPQHSFIFFKMGAPQG